MEGFVGATLSTAVLDSSCTKNVCGDDTLMKCYLETLSKEDVSTVETTRSSTLFKFGNGKRVKSEEFKKISSIIAGKKIFIETDFVDCKILLLLRKNAMKRAEMRITFATDIRKEARFVVYIFRALLYTRCFDK